MGTAIEYRVLFPIFLFNLGAGEVVHSELARPQGLDAFPKVEETVSGRYSDMALKTIRRFGEC